MNTTSEFALLGIAKTLSIMLTHQCPAKCADCGTFSGPTVKESISAKTAKKYIGEAAAADFKLVVFTGGEATLRWNDLLECIAYARSLNLKTRLVTNAHWATTKSVAKCKLVKLVGAGLDEINYSTGDEHAKFIPLIRVVNATIAAIRIDLALCIMIESRKARSVTRDVFIALCVDGGLSPGESRKIAIVESPWMPIDPARVEKYRDNLSVNHTNSEKQNVCDSVLSTYTVQANGNIAACCGMGMQIVPELTVGDTSSVLSDVMRTAECDFLKIALRYIGPHRLLAWAAKKNPLIVWENMYAHHCQACLRIYDDENIANVLRYNFGELQDEILDAISLEKKYRRILIKNSEIT